MNTYTIGFTQKSAQEFFSLIKRNNVIRILDVRLNNVSQLAAFAKRDDLKYFLSEICGADYVHLTDLAPEKDMLNAYKKNNITWESYQDKYLNLMAKRKIERIIDKTLFDGGCLLCSEEEPHFCHRRLAVEYLANQWGSDMHVVHLI